MTGKLVGVSSAPALDDIADRLKLPTLVGAAGEQASLRFLEFCAGTIRNPHTRRAYARAVADFLIWCEDAGVPSMAAVQPFHVATWIDSWAPQWRRGSP